MTTSPTEPSQANDIAPELLQELGRIVVTWGQIESVLSDFLVFLLQANTATGFVLSPLVTGSNLTAAVRTLARLRISESDGLLDVLELLDRVDQIRPERNEIIHGVWHTRGASPGIVFVQSIRWGRTDVGKNLLLTRNDLVDISLELRPILAGLTALRRLYGFPRIDR